MRRSPVWHYFELGKALVYGGGTLNLLNHLNSASNSFEKVKRLFGEVKWQCIKADNTWRREGLYKEVALKSAQK